MSTAIPEVTPRMPDEPTPALTDYHVVHRAMTVDARRLADVAAAFAAGRETPSRARATAVRDYLAGMSHEIHSHHQVEDDAVWPLLESLIGDSGELDGLTSDHRALDPLLDRAAGWAKGLAERPTDRAIASGLTQTLRELSELLDEHVEHEERFVFPLIRRCLRVADYAWLQRRFRRNLTPRQLSFVVPWVAGHATADELPRMVGDAGWPLRLLLWMFRRGFAARQRLVFGTP